ncbi:MAG: acetyl-CoA carboxylase biotin carboxyl carrier protein subunit [Clostridiaceae bacterium]|nr:acetyl-CoA carboxylase biotin carboxyl carrier protein subunit [Clostridiaceae bacterium]
MKKFIAKVNGKEYVVELEEVAGSAPSLAETVRPVNTVPEIKPVQTPAAKAEVIQPEAPAPKKTASSDANGSIRIESPMPGTIISVKVSTGQAVKKNQVVAVLEAMKMENDIVAAQDGVIASVNVSNGESVETGQLLVSMN